MANKVHPESCFGCRFALEFQDKPRTGEQVRCGKAEQLFGTDLKGKKRWVDVRKGKNGDYLKAKCGTFEPFTGDDSRSPDVEEPAQKVKKLCGKCNGSGNVKVKFINSYEYMNCHACGGQGSIVE
jgi:hypothetical protein